ncbi:hypothetical protein WR25_26738 [Diploscapter pachys]|uniref:Rho-GAP domain-containing protein n=1 Tax=Diploscapter pachys TaxID=2018661 RepID=A0A2A2JLC3_9BILA|nr:hypothetical protein WR25_26738 [Diploscapter pachys]
MRGALTQKGRSSSWGDHSSMVGMYNITQGLRHFHHGSAFLPAFVVENCHAQLDDNGFEFVQQCFNSLEEKGIAEQGLYRNCGVTSKVQKLMQLGLEKKKAGERLVIDEKEWETKTISSAVKTFLRNLPEPLMTFELHNTFINAAKWDDSRTRLEHIHYYVYKLPPDHKRMLEMVIRHLRRVADRSDENLMTVGNLGVCFGPTLLRPKEETMSAIMDIKFCNVVVEILIVNYDRVFHSPPPEKIGPPPCPAKPEHRSPASTSAFESNTSSTGNHSLLSSSSTCNPPARSLEKMSSGGLMNRPRVSTHPTSTSHQGFSSTTVATASSSSKTPPAHGPPPPISQSQTPSSSSSLSQQEYDYNNSKSSGTGGANSQRNSTSAATTPTTPRSSYNNYDSMPGAGAGTSQGGKGRVESADSLNSSGSGGSDTLIPAIDEADGLVVGSQAPTTSKLSTTSYAPPYNPMNFTGETFHRVQAVPAKSVISTCSLSLAPRSLRPTPRFSSATLLHSTVPLQPSQRCRTLYNCTSDHPSELSFSANQIITNVQQSKEDGWLVGTLNGKTGLVPANYVEMLP